MKTTITIDTDLCKVVPLEPTHEMTVAAYEVDRTLALVYDALLAAVPADLPGVVAHSGEPAAEVIAGHWGGPEFQALIDWEMIPFGTILFAHPPAQPDTAALQVRSQNDQIEMDTLLRGLQLNRRTIREKQEEIDTLQARIAELEAQLKFERASASPLCSMCAQAARGNAWTCECLNCENQELQEKLEAQLAAQAGQLPDGPFATLHDDGYYTFKAGKKPHSASYAGWRMDVYTVPPAPASPLAIVQAALEAAAQVIENGQETTTCSEDDTFRHITQRSRGNLAGIAFADAIRAIDPQTILDGMGK